MCALSIRATNCEGSISPELHKFFLYTGLHDVQFGSRYHLGAMGGIFRDRDECQHRSAGRRGQCDMVELQQHHHCRYKWNITAEFNGDALLYFIEYRNRQQWQLSI